MFFICLCFMPMAMIHVVALPHFQIGTAAIISHGVVIVVEMEALLLNVKPFL